MSFFVLTRNQPLKRWVTLFFIAVDCCLLAALIWYWLGPEPIDSLTSNATHIELPSEMPAPDLSQTPVLNWTHTEIQPEDSLTRWFNRHHLDLHTLNQLFELELVNQKLSTIHPGQTIDFATQNQQLQKLKIALTDGDTLIIERSGTHFQAHITHPEKSTAVDYLGGDIQSSLHRSASQAGLSEGQIAELSHIFADRINFRRDIRPGDHFDVLIENTYKNGVISGSGHIIAADFINRGKHHLAIRYQFPGHATAYYTPEGKSLKRRFLAKPLHYNRISSYFSYHRIDPILHKRHPHLGVDFAAPRGTPVHSVSDGKVTFIGKKGGYGNAIIIQYGKHYRALFGHLSRFAKGLQRGDSVHQGQVVAYVGSTGWSTGPHLHYSFYIDGRPKNPLKLKLPKASEIPSHYLSAFQQRAKTLRNELQLQQGPALTANPV